MHLRAWRPCSPAPRSPRRGSRRSITRDARRGRHGGRRAVPGPTGALVRRASRPPAVGDCRVRCWRSPRCAGRRQAAPAVGHTCQRRRLAEAARARDAYVVAAAPRPALLDAATRSAPAGPSRWSATARSTRVRARAERALTRGSRHPQGALARGMVLGQDDALTATTARRLPRRRARASRRRERRERRCCSRARARRSARAPGSALRARLWLAARADRAYVPLAGGGPSIQRAGVMGAAGLVAALAGRPASRWYALLLAAAFDARAEPARGRGSRLAAQLRRRRRDRCCSRRAAARCADAGVPRALADARRHHGRRDARHGAADRAALRARLARRRCRPTSSPRPPSRRSCGSGRSPPRSASSRRRWRAVPALAALPLALPHLARARGRGAARRAGRACRRRARRAAGAACAAARARGGAWRAAARATAAAPRSPRCVPSSRVAAGAPARARRRGRPRRRALASRSSTSARATRR